MTSWRLVIQCPPSGFPPSPNERLHWAAKAKRNAEWRQLVYIAAFEASIPRLEKARVSVTFFTSRGALSDFDNLVAKSKPICDGLTGWSGGHSTLLSGVLVDDSAVHCERGPVTEVRERGAKRIEILVERL